MEKAIVTDLDKEAAEMLRKICEGTASTVGQDFFRSLAYHLIDTIGIRYALITECANITKTRVRTLVYIERDRLLDNFEYDLSGTPCEIVMRGEDYSCVNDLDTMFNEEGIKSYFGVPIFISNGEVMGHIAIFDKLPMEIDQKKLNILKIFASRAGAEIERKQKDELLQDKMIRYKNLFEDSPIGLTEEDFSEVKKYIDELKAKYTIDLKTILYTRPEEIRNCNDRLRWIDVNHAQLQLFGVASKEEYFDYIRGRFQPDVFREVLVALDGGAKHFEREVSLTTASGEKRYLKAKRTILPGSENTWKKSIVSCVDITEQKLGQEQLKEALHEVEFFKQKLEAENIYLQQEIKLEHNFDEIISHSEVFKKVLEKIELVAETDATVLILGESGTGKELIARAIHGISKRATRPLVKVNCATLPANLIESELFGHEKGAFTGAVAQKIGRFELADGGTIFLDEIGELPLELQAKLLRILQEGEFERLGSSKTIAVDVRVITATNRDLEAASKRNEFRADLFYRLNVFPVYSPPLRERKEDIPVLVQHFCKKYGNQFGKKITTIPRPTLDALVAYDWPGNVRELENIIERGIIISKSGTLELGEWLPKNAVVQSQYLPGHTVAKPETDTMNLVDREKQHIINVLHTTRWKIRGEDGAARILGLKPTTLEARMKKLGIKRRG